MRISDQQLDQPGQGVNVIVKARDLRTQAFDFLFHGGQPTTGRAGGQA